MRRLGPVHLGTAQLSEGQRDAGGGDAVRRPGSGSLGGHHKGLPKGSKLQNGLNLSPKMGEKVWSCLVTIAINVVDPYL